MLTVLRIKRFMITFPSGSRRRDRQIDGPTLLASLQKLCLLLGLSAELSTQESVHVTLDLRFLKAIFCHHLRNQIIAVLKSHEVLIRKFVPLCLNILSDHLVESGSFPEFVEVLEVFSLQISNIILSAV